MEEDCEFCDGTGDCPDCLDGDDDCPTCGGAGICQECDGTGIDLDDDE